MITKTLKFTILSIFVIAISNISYSQTTTNNLCYNIDEFDDKKTLLGGTTIFYTDGGNLKNEGILLQPTFDSSNKLKLQTLIIQIYDTRITCLDEENTLDIIFEDDSKVKLVSWNKFNCEGTSYFDLSKKNIDDFKTKKLKAIRYTDVRNFNKITVKENLTENNSKFIMNILNEIDAVNNGESEIGVCKK